MAKKISKTGLLFLALGGFFLYATKIGFEIEAQGLPDYSQRTSLTPLLVIGLVFFIVGGSLMIGSLTSFFKKK